MEISVKKYGGEREFVVFQLQVASFYTSWYSFISEDFIIKIKKDNHYLKLILQRITLEKLLNFSEKLRTITIFLE